MKRFFILSLIALFLSMSGNAQIYLDSPDNRPHFGVKLGLDFTSQRINEPSPYNMGAGFTITGTYNIPVLMNFYVEPGIAFYYNTWGLKGDILNDDNNHYNNLSAGFRNFGIKIPVNAGYHFDINIGQNDFLKLYLFTGPSFKFGLTNDLHCKVKSGIHTQKYNENLYDGEYNRFDFVWNLGFAAEYRNIMLGYNAEFGCCNQPKNVNSKIRTGEIFIGYNF